MRYKEPKHRTILEATKEELAQLLEKSKMIIGSPFIIFTQNLAY